MGCWQGAWMVAVTGEAAGAAVGSLACLEMTLHLHDEETALYLCHCLLACAPGTCYARRACLGICKGYVAG